MITKEAKRQAERIRPIVAELLDRLATFATAWEYEERQHTKKYNIYYAWQYFREYSARENNPEDAAEAKTTHDTNPRAWVQKVEELSEAEKRARVSLYVSRVNFQNMANYTAARIAELVRPFWRLLTLRRGFEDLGELLTPEYSDKDKDTAHAFRLWFKISGGNVGAQLFPASFIRLDCHISPRGIACGIFGKVEGVKMGEDVPDTPKEIKEPHRLTVAEYKKAVERLEEISKTARSTLNKLSHEAGEIVKALGLAGFVEYLNGYILQITK